MDIPDFMGQEACDFLSKFLPSSADILGPGFEFHDVDKDDFTKAWRGRVDVAVELGVLVGNHARHIYDNIRPGKLYLVDPWDTTDPHYRNQKALQSYYDTVAAKFKDETAKGKVEIWREQSYTALQKFAKGSVDWIFIDADHRFHCALLDLVLSDRIMSARGNITGHDFSGRFGIPPAVAEFCRHYPWQLQALTRGPHSVFTLCRKS